MADPYDDDADEDTLPNVPALRQAFSRAVLTGTDPSSPTGDYSGIEDRRIAGARHEMNWANTFVNTPPSEVLRARRDYVGLVNQAVERKQQLMAQTDIRAMKLYQKGAEFEEWQRQAPLRDATMIAELDKKRYDADKDFITASDSSKFIKAMNSLQTKPGTKEHVAEVLNIAAEHPYALTTEVGKEIFKRHAVFNDVASQIQQARDAFKSIGQDVTSVQTTAEGNIISHGKPKDEILEEELKGRGLSLAQFRNPVSVKVVRSNPDQTPEEWEGDEQGDIVRVDTGTKKGGKVDFTRAEYLALGGKLSEKSQPKEAAKPKTVRQGGVTYTLQPDGTYK